MSKSKPVKLFDIRKIEVTDPKTKKKVTKPKVQFVKGIKISINGEDVDLGEYNSLFLKNKEELFDNLDYAQENFGLSEKYVDEQKAYIEEKNISSVCEVPGKK